MWSLSLPRDIFVSIRLAQTLFGRSTYLRRISKQRSPYHQVQRIARQFRNSRQDFLQPIYYITTIWILNMIIFSYKNFYENSDHNKIETLRLPKDIFALFRLGWTLLGRNKALWNK